MKESTRIKAEALLNHLKAEDLNHVESFKAWLDAQAVQNKTVVQPTVQPTSRWVDTSNQFTPQEVKKKVVAAGKRVVRSKNIEDAVIDEGLVIEKSEVVTDKGVATMGEHEHETSEDADKSLILAAVSKETVEEIIQKGKEVTETVVTDEELMITHGGKDGIIKYLKEQKVRIRKDVTEEKALQVLRGYMENT